MKRTPAKSPRWTPFEQCDAFNVNGTAVAIPDGCAVVRNNVYQVVVHVLTPRFPFGEVVWLSIKRRDRRVIHDWRDLQRIKNALVGPDIEAVELYPAEARLMDTANQYHLWCFTDGYQLPFGYADRRVSEGSVEMSKQRPFRDDERPADCGAASDHIVESLVVPPTFGIELWNACYAYGANVCATFAAAVRDDRR